MIEKRLMRIYFPIYRNVWNAILEVIGPCMGNENLLSFIARLGP